MKYQMLAQKYRPRSFNDFVGQVATIQAMINSLEHNRIHHTLLFLGPRGTGKTSLARVFTKCLNCHVKMSAQFCNDCLTCRAINDNQLVDFFEIDAASRTRVEGIQSILDNVQYKPTLARYKVYLIDEVHMLSMHSFNALLKTLEEPPEHAIFILATTEPHRLPSTIKSRGLQFYFKNLTPENIIEKLSAILKQENLSYEDKALEYIAQAAQGSLRDAINLLEQVILYNNVQQITAKDVASVLGYVSETDILALIDAIHTGQIDALSSTIKLLVDNGVDFEQALVSLMTKLHQMTIAQLSYNTRLEEESAINKFAQWITPEQIQLYYQIALMGRRDLALAPTLRQGFEMTLLRMLAFRPVSLNATAKQQAISTSLSKEKRLPIASREIQKNTTHLDVQKNNTHPNSSQSLVKHNHQAIALNWHETIKKLPVTGLLKSFALHCTLSDFEGDHIHLCLDPTQKVLYSKERENLLQTILSKYFQKTIQLKIEIASHQDLTPAAIELAQSKAQEKEIKESILNDTGVKSIMERFDATIQENSILSKKTEVIYE